MSLDFWKTTCTKAFNNDAEANDFVLFIEGCRTQQASNGVYTWKTTRTDYEHQLQQLGCQPVLDKPSTWMLPSEALIALNETKRAARTEWHTQRQLTLKKHLDETLALINSPLDINYDQRLALVRQFMKNHETDLGAVPFLRGLVGFLKYQLRDKLIVAEWTMSEYVLTQNNEDAMESYIRLLRGVLGFQLVYKDEDEDEEDRLAINMDNNTPKEQNETDLIVWRMNPDFDNQFIQAILNCLPKEHNTTTGGYHQSTALIRRNKPSHTNLIQWIYNLLTHCLSFLHNNK